MRPCMPCPVDDTFSYIRLRLSETNFVGNIMTGGQKIVNPGHSVFFSDFAFASFHVTKSAGRDSVRPAYKKQ